ncbi:hypothetical protein [Edaphovirga cremea]|uniref:hypothetical protein n=1 Tax=Edaphovirga cremea TaxID=2267246 RepID=UPI000DEF961C|nr:hypothetical protein [Edaphovirga cremea]
MMGELNELIDLMHYFPADIQLLIIQTLLSVAAFSLVAKMLTFKSSKELIIAIYIGFLQILEWIKKADLYFMKQTELPQKYPKAKRIIDFLVMLFLYWHVLLFIIILVLFSAVFIHGNGSIKSIAILFFVVYVTIYFIKFYFAQAEKIRLELKR